MRFTDVVSADGTVAYTPNTGFSGTDAFTYRTSGGSLQSDAVTVATTVYVEAVENVVPNDADDDQVIAAAIVSGDADLLAMGSHEGVPIITAAQAEQRIAG